MLYKEGRKGARSVTLDYQPSSNQIVITSDYIDQDENILDRKGLTRLLWQNTSKIIAKRNNVKSNYEEKFEDYNIRFETDIKNVKKLAFSNNLGDPIKTSVNSILTAYQEMRRTPEVLAKLIADNL